jgi:uncharacterized protein
MKNFERSIYLNRIKPFVLKNVIKVVVGQRRVGKSFFLKQIRKYIELNFPEIPCIYINMEDLAFETIRTYTDLVKYAESKRTASGKHAIFIDEVQEISEFEKSLRHFQTNDLWDIYCTGSNARLLSGELATYLSGRYIEIPIYSLSYNEFLHFHQIENTADSLNKYLKYGGLPYLINLEMEDEIVFDYLKNIFNSVLYKDIVLRHNIRNVSFISRLCNYMADNIGRLISAKNISDYLKSQGIHFSNNIVLDYLIFLQNAFVVFGIKRYDIKGKRILEIGEKIYFQDLGLRNSLIGYKYNDISQLLENAVLMHLQVQGWTAGIGKSGDKEIDFVCERNAERLYIQVCLSLTDENVRKREIGNLLDIKDNYRKITITADEITPNTIEGVEIWNIRKFLSEF